jgi:dTDP-4-dehydrorhamnose reductase
VPEATLVGRTELDVTNAEAVSRASERADVIVHLAALTNVDGCEEDPAAATRINHLGTRNVADAASRWGARLIYVSTDYVFDGHKQGEYDESDAPDPVNVYGRTKLAGESEVMRAADRWVVRSSWIFGDGHNFIRTVIDRAREGLPLRIVDDQIGRPTSATAVAAAVKELIDRSGEGIVNVAGDGEPCSWADLAGFAVGCAGLDVNIERISTETYRAEASRVIAPRPARSVLSLDRARALDLPLLDWRDSVRKEIRTMR